jgi:quercetin dioxygenase-like cupin family protein
MKTTVITIAAAIVVATGLALHTTHAQQAGIKRSDVVRQDLNLAGHEAIQVRVDFAPGAAFGNHTHPGTEIAYVLEGSLEYQLEGKPVTLKAGEALFIPAGAVHSARNVSASNASELATYVVEKGKQLVVLTK